MQKDSLALRKLHAGMADLRETFGRKECLHPEAPQRCRGNIVKAHTVQKSGGLTSIAEGGHVLTPDPYSDPTQMTKIGINKASTFTGFCEFHDDSLFAPIEKRPLQLTRRHAFLLAFRAISKELFLKRGTVEHEIADDSPFPHFWLNYQADAKRALRDLQPIYDEMGKAIANKRFRNTSFYTIEFDSIPQVLCTGAPNVEFDFHGNRIQLLTRYAPREYITLSMLPFDRNRSVAVFAWHGKSNANEKFIRSLSLLSKRDIPDAIVRFAFQSIENMFLAPPWWDNLPEPIKERLLARYDSSFWRDGSEFIDLRADGNHYVNWKVVGKRKNNLGLRG